MAETLNNTEEQQLLDAVKKAVDLVDRGQEPDAAIEKVARADGYGPGRIRLVAHAYNNGRQLSQWRHGGNILDKLASFTLADPEKVIDRIYSGASESEKKASESIDKDYSLPPSWLERPLQEKRARAPLPLPTTSPLEPYQCDPMYALNKAYGDVQREKQAMEDARRLASVAEDKVRMKVAQLVTYFKQASYDRLPFEHTEHAARSYLGSASIPLLDMVYKQARLKEKRASDKIPVLVKGLNLESEPFTIIQEAIKAAETCNKLRLTAKSASEKATLSKEASLRPFLNAGGSKPSAQMSSVQPLGEYDRAAAIFSVKSATGWLSEVAAIGAGDVLGQAVHRRVDPEHPEEEENVLDDAENQSEISGIKNRVTLDTMLANPANPLSKLPAPDVINAYNQIIKTTPHLADKPEALQPLLEQHLKTTFENKNKVVTALDKLALLDMGLNAAAGMAGRSLGEIPKQKSDLIRDKWMELEDPHHHDELRKIRAHTLLTQLLTDHEDPISGHDPDKVLAAYNELSAASPRVADNIHTLRPALRRKLEGHQEPFEAKELLDIEKGLAISRPPAAENNTAGTQNRLMGY